MSLEIKFKNLFSVYKSLQISKTNSKEVFHNTAYSVQLPYRAGHSL